MGLSTAIWNSRYWLAGLHVLFLVALWVSFFIVMLIMSNLPLGDLHLLRHTWRSVIAYWYVPFLFMTPLWIIAGLLAAQSPMELTRSDPADAVGFNKFQNRVESLCIARHIPVPQLYIIDYPAINALIWGRQEYRLYVTKEACETLTTEQLDAMFAQQLAHLHDGDNHIFPMMYLFVLMGGQLTFWTLAGIGWFILYNPQVIISPLIAPITVLTVGFGFLWLAFRFYGAWYGRKRRFAADLFAIQLSQNALALIGAIEKAKDHARMPIVPEEWRALAFLDTDPVLTLPWYTDPDERIMGLRKTLGMTIHDGR